MHVLYLGIGSALLSILKLVLRWQVDFLNHGGYLRGDVVLYRVIGTARVVL